MSNANDLLLFMGGGDPYAEATHWLTVGADYSPTSTRYGFLGSDTMPFGDINPRTLGSTTLFQLMFDEITGVSFIGNEALERIGNEVFVLRLDNGKSATFKWQKANPNAKFESHNVSGDPLGLKDSDGQTIPLKIEII